MQSNRQLLAACSVGFLTAAFALFAFDVDASAPSAGAIRAAVGSSINRHEICPVTHHPRTGRLLVGFRVPEWQAVRKLAVDAANAFRPLRSIGRDVAVTPGSPRLIEGNVTWDTLTGDPQMGEIYRYLRELAFSTAGDA